MPRKTSSPWDFGELFPAQATRKVFSVGDLTRRIKGLLEQQIGAVWVAGEITNLRAQSSGHIYFTLKDRDAQISGVLFRGTAGIDRAALRDGVNVVLQGDLSVYEPRGQYQLVVRAVELQGVGALAAAFERLKQRLQAEGLFDAGRKRPLPRFPVRVGLVTSPTGAALRDVLHVLGRRYAGLDLVLAPSRVQGQGAEAEIAGALQALNDWSASAPGRRLDVILLTRGGGSLEDLWCFNEEKVARAIHASSVPVLSAVGHEIDFTIADFVADVRAATPSAAAELLTAGYVAGRDAVSMLTGRLQRQLGNAVEVAVDQLGQLAARLQRAHPRRQVEERAQRLDDLVLAMGRRVREQAAAARQRQAAAAARLQALRPRRRLEEAAERVTRATTDLQAALRRRLQRQRETLTRLDLRLRLLSPEHTLARGYSITVQATTGTLVRQAEQAPEGTELLTRLASGGLRSVVVRPLPGDPGVGERIDHDATHGKPPRHRSPAADPAPAVEGAPAAE